MKILLCGELNLVKISAEYLQERGDFPVILIPQKKGQKQNGWGKDFFVWETDELTQEASHNLTRNTDLVILVYPYTQCEAVEDLLASPYLTGKFIILVNSYHVYGTPRILPVQEDSLASPAEERGWKELIIEDKLKFYSYKTHFSPIILRTGEMYGPGVEGWISRSIRNVLEDKEITLWEKGEGIFDLLYVQDFLRALERVIEDRDKLRQETINIASGRATPLKTIARKILSLAHKEENRIKFSHLPPPFPQVTLSPSKARILLSWTPRYSAEKGIQLTFNSMEKSPGGTGKLT